MRRYLIVCVLISVTISVFSLELSIPTPMNKKLYTEYRFEKSSAYVKNPILGSGTIAMDGDNFVYIQDTPSKLKVLKIKDSMSLTVGDNAPMRLPSTNESMEGGDISILFTSPERVQEVFTVESVCKGAKVYYTLTPKETARSLKGIRSIKMISVAGTLEMLELSYQSMTIMKFYFSNTVEGESPDEALFK